MLLVCITIVYIYCMKQDFLKILFLFIAICICVPLLIMVWPNTNMLTGINSQDASQATSDSANLTTITDTPTGVSISFPANYRQNESGISGPENQNARKILTIDTLSPELEYGSGAPFNGMAFYAVPWQGTLEQLVAQEATALQNTGEDVTENKLEGKTEPVAFGELQGFKLTGYNSLAITRIYLELPEKDQILVVAITQESEGSFMLQAEQILQSIEITK